MKSVPIKPLEYFTSQLTMPQLIEAVYGSESGYIAESYRKKPRQFFRLDTQMRKHPISGYGQVIRLHNIQVGPNPLPTFAYPLRTAAPAIFVFKEPDNQHAFIIQTIEVFHWDVVIKRFLDEVYPGMKPEEDLRDYLKPMMLMASI